jgi:HPt (histidine-containing phosphotransfer) domain-containing protein
LREYADESLTLSVTRAGGALVRLSLRRAAHAPPLNKAALGTWTAANAGPESRLRAALAARLCELMQGNFVSAPDTPDGSLFTLSIALQPADDPAQTGKFRIATAPKNASATPPVHARRATDRAVAEGDGAIDFMYLDRQLGSLARTILVRTAPAFLASIEARMTSLVVAQQSGDLARLGAIAQAWKGSAMSVGARPLAQLLGAMEKQAAGGQLPGEESSRQISLALERLQRALERFCHDHPGSP